MPDLHSPGLLTTGRVSFWAEINGELFWCRTAASARTLVPTGFHFDEPPICFEASSENGRLRFAICWASGIKTGND